MFVFLDLGMFDGHNEPDPKNSYPHEVFTSDGTGGAYAGLLASSVPYGSTRVTIPQKADPSWVGAAVAVLHGPGCRPGSARRERQRQQLPNRSTLGLRATRSKLINRSLVHHDSSLCGKNNHGRQPREELDHHASLWQWYLNALQRFISF
jgi:hypothetical protein